MTREDYKSERARLEIEYTSNVNKLCEDFANANNPYKVGDIITDGKSILRIKEASWDLDKDRYPYYEYRGIQLTPMGLPSGNQTVTMLHQYDVTERIIDESANFDKDGVMNAILALTKVVTKLNENISKVIKD